MDKLKTPPGRAIALAAALTALATPALAQDRFDWGGGRSGEREYGLVGAGVPGSCRSCGVPIAAARS